jgi:predicted nucleic-acid-binding protein
MIRIDTNYIVRYLINDNLEMANAAEKILQSERVFIANEIIAEVIYVLSGVYGTDRETIADLLLELTDFENILLSDTLTVKRSLEIFKTRKLDYVDCLLCAYSREDTIVTFDKKLNKCIKSISGSDSYR